MKIFFSVYFFVFIAGKNKHKKSFIMMLFYVVGKCYKIKLKQKSSKIVRKFVGNKKKLEKRRKKLEENKLE